MASSNAQSRRRCFGRLGTAAFALVAVSALAPSAGAQAIPGRSAVALPVTTPGTTTGSTGTTTSGIALSGSQLSVLSKSKTTGNVPTSQVIRFTVSLKPQDAAGLQAFVDSVSDPTSVNYQKFATPSDLGQRFGASAATQNAVVSFLQSHGIKVTTVAASRMAVLAQGTAAQINAAFGTTLKQYQGPSPDGKSTWTFYANSTPLYLPSNLVNNVVAVSGVENYTRPIPRMTTSTLTPALVHGLYGDATAFNSNFLGQGKTIAISNWDGYRLSDAQSFISTFHLPTPAGGATSNITIIPINGTQSGPGTPSGEGDLDIQMALSTAPLANILVYDGADGLQATLVQEQEDNRADVISESYGWALGNNDAMAAHNEHLLMEAQGMTYMAASGDDGTQIEPFAYPDYDPEVLMVGGTTATVDASTGERVREVAWSDDVGAGGGGWTTESVSFNTLPSWQKGRGVPTTIKYRLVPDVALHAGGGGTGGQYIGAYDIFTSGSEIAIDGTSASCPTFAAHTLILEQRIATANPTKPYRLGRVQDLIYSQNGRSDIWFDVTSGSNGKLPNGTTSTAGIGWDFATGWGAPSFDMLYRLIEAKDTPYAVMPSQAWSYPKQNPATDVHTDISTDDSDYADIPSTYTAGLGWTAGVEAIFNLQPGSNNSVYDLGVNFTGLTQAGATLQFYAYDWTKKQYVLLTSKPSAASVSVDFGTGAAIAPYVSSTNQVDMIVRALVPVRPGNGSFVFSVNKVNAIAYYIPNN